MHGGGLGGLAPGQWSDDTEMAICIAQVAATGAELRSEGALDAIAAGFLRRLADGPPDIGVQTGRVLREAAGAGGGADDMRRIAVDLHGQTGRTVGNGSLMRTSPVPLAHLGDADATVVAARAVSELTHHDPVAATPASCGAWLSTTRCAPASWTYGSASTTSTPATGQRFWTRPRR